jgi:hypothetical protein
LFPEAFCASRVTRMTQEIDASRDGRYSQQSSKARIETVLTAVWIIYAIICDVDGTSVELAPGRDIRNTTCDLRPQLLACRVIGQQRCGLPYGWELVNIRGQGRIVIWGTFGGWVCAPAELA